MTTKLTGIEAAREAVAKCPSLSEAAAILCHTWEADPSGCASVRAVCSSYDMPMGGLWACREE